MKTIFRFLKCGYLPAGFLALSMATGFSQGPIPLRPPTPPAAPAPPAAPGEKDGLTRFDLDFPGGRPGELVAAIQKAMGRPLNALVPEEFKEIKLPPLKMMHVNVAELFKALELSSMKTETMTTGSYYGGGNYSGYKSVQAVQTGYGFKTQGTPSDDCIWYFYVQRPALPEGSSSKTCRFYSLAAYLERGLTVDDITTAIETGWKMLGETAPPKISFHADTKLLIAVGEANKLETIDAVLQALTPPKPPTPFSGPKPPAKPAEAPKTETP
jgi:hypothetical protein